MKLHTDQKVRIANLSTTKHVLYAPDTLLSRNEKHLALLKTHTVESMDKTEHVMVIRYVQKDYAPV